MANMAGSDTDRFPFGLTGPLGAVRPLDALIAGYVGLAALPLALGATRGVPGCARQLLADLAVLAGLVLICALSRRSRRWPLVLLRLVYAPLLFTLLYRQAATIWPVLYDQPFDALLVRAEQALWGGQPSLAFAQYAPWSWLSELFCLAYFAYYFLTPAMVFTLLFTRGYATTERIIFATALCFFGCYALFWLLPVVGPQYWFPPHAGPRLFPGHVFNRLLYLLTSSGEVPAGGFPSSHIAVALLLTIQARRLAPRLFPFMVAVTVVMCPAVVYLRAHYLVDVPAGIVVGLLMTSIMNRAARTQNAAPGLAAARRGIDFHS